MSSVKPSAADFTRAIVRTPGPDAADGLTTSHLGRPELPLLLAQHSAYIDTLRTLGLEVMVLPPLPGFPDAYFVEDAAVVTPTIAVITRPGAPSRRGEVASIESALARLLPIARIEPPGTIEGGDVLRVGNRFFIGLSDRTHEDGARQLVRILDKHGFEGLLVPVGAGLHLKSSINSLGGDHLVVAAGFVPGSAFAEYDLLVLDPGDDYAANTLCVNGTLLVPAGFPRARRRLERRGLPIREVATSEMRKMDGGLTCLSLRF